jgi:hypothetical protein
MRYTEISEAPQAIPGDWKDGNLIVAQQSLLVHHLKWRKVGTITAGPDNFAYDITQLETTYQVGREDEEKDKFMVIGRLELDGSLTESFGYPNLQSVNAVYVANVLQGYQIGTKLYRFVVQSGITLLSDMSQYFGARRLWSRLSQQADMIVDVVDTEKKSVVAQGVKLHQGKTDADFDQAYWSYDINAGKQNIRFVLRDISSTT